MRFLREAEGCCIDDAEDNSLLEERADGAGEEE